MSFDLPILWEEKINMRGRKSIKTAAAWIVGGGGGLFMMPEWFTMGAGADSLGVPSVLCPPFELCPAVF